ncbi:NAD-dependent epimerase/dehydratase family protein [Sediminibacterium sp.]|uniref:NAD-dependent epimerase/dehydratase family protein n=1 Tax=Sediminibacterium sp. TaxID=1917865 RepID=UPI002734965E|nr:NAD-dependent epimerase/dehydratase family protein [Sediminibacterium sp.]MDP3394684.1 NAD-dependent epimerase/dehydratase family protein [Sediminibacterium sp.]MDP3568519.1 NAD-dependent epimerase/dehydratase family protein [Sediminibacterium sp.]
MILVTGASGLVGSHLLQQLVQTGQSVKALYRNTIPTINNTEGVEWIKGDILDVVSLEESMDQIDQVYHCAAVVSFNPAKKGAMQHTNIEGTANVVNACINKGVKRLLFVSSVAALGRIREDKPIDETMNWTPETSNSEYGKTKYLSEMEVWRGMSEGLSVVVVNPVIILGNGDWEAGSSGIFKSAYNEFPWYTEGMSGFVDVKDVVRAMVLLMNSAINGERFILSGHNAFYKDLFGLIAAAFQKKPPHKKVTPILAAIVWRLEAIKAFFSGKDPLLTKETAKTARAKVSFNNTKLLKQFPAFTYTPLSESIGRICGELKQKYQL